MLTPNRIFHPLSTKSGWLVYCQTEIEVQGAMSNVGESEENGNVELV
jgi:hypothetical protein